MKFSQFINFFNLMYGSNNGLAFRQINVDEYRVTIRPDLTVFWEHGQWIVRTPRGYQLGDTLFNASSSPTYYDAQCQFKSQQQ